MNKERKIQGQPAGRRYPSKIWVVLAILSFLMLTGTFFGHMDEISLKHFAHSLEADYIEEGKEIRAEYTDENGTLHTYNLSSYFPVHNGDKITLYYATDVAQAIPENNPFSWFLYYVPYGGIFAFSMWRIRKGTKVQETLK